MFNFHSPRKSGVLLIFLCFYRLRILNNVNALYYTIEIWRKVVTIKRFDIRDRLTFDLMLVRGLNFEGFLFWSFICQIYVTSLDASNNTQVKNIIDTRSFTHTLGIEQVLREGIEVDRVNEDIEVRYCLSKIWLKHFDSLRLFLR